MTKRIPNDQYFTPPGLIYPLFREVEFHSDLIYFEPCAGDGAIAEALRHEVDDELVFTADIVTSFGHDFNGFDATDIGQWDDVPNEIGDINWVITNPPYKQPDCDRIIQNAWEYAQEGIAMLLRLSYLEPCQNRAKFLQSAPLSNLIIFNPRPQFIPGKKATDSSTVAWFVWRKNWQSRGTKITFCTHWNED